MSHTVRVVCEATEIDENITVPEDTLVLDLLIHGGVNDVTKWLTYRFVYYQHTQPIVATVLQPVTSVPEGETLFVRERD